ncbi:MAG: glycosyltransferase [Gammaproteobacteria bacterium]
MTQPSVSVYILTCNQQRYIKQCVESALAQASDISLEILVGDDCSNDDTSQILEEMATTYPEEITHIRHPHRLGPMMNCQVLLRQAKGELLAHLDGDDYWLPGKLKLQLAYMAANPGCAAVYTNAITVREDGSTIGLFNNEGNGRYDLAAMLRRGNFLNTSSMVFRSELKAALLEIKEPFIDYRIHLRHARTGFLTQLKQPLVGYRVNSIGAMTSTTASNDMVRKLYWEAILDVPRNLVTDNDLAHGVTDFLRRVISRALRTRRWELIREWVPQVYETSPYGITRTSLLVMGSVIRATFLVILGKLQTAPDGYRVNIRHRR